MQKNQEIGKIQKDVPILLGRAVHHFIRDLTQKCAEVSLKNGKSGSCMNYKLTKDNVRSAIMTNHKFAFLKNIVADMPVEEKDKTQN